MSALAQLAIRARMQPITAVEFTGGSENAAAIIDWALEGGATNRGHFRPGAGRGLDSVFIPVADGQVLRLDRGSYLVRYQPGQFATLECEEFHDRFEVIP